MSVYVTNELGTVIEYRDGNYIQWYAQKGNFLGSVYQGNPENGGRFIARIPSGCLASFDRPYSVCAAADAKKRSLEQYLEIVCQYVRAIPVNWHNKKRLQELKSELSNFDARSGYWK